MWYGGDMTTTYTIKMTNNDGLVVRKGDTEPGQYIGFDAPWEGEPHQFVAETFSEAKRQAQEFLRDQIEMYEDWLYVVDECRLKDAR